MQTHIIAQAKRFIQEKPSKILTAATTGLVFAIPMAKYLQVPVVYARKERSVVMSSTYQAVSFEYCIFYFSSPLWLNFTHESLIRFHRLSQVKLWVRIES